MVERVTQGLSVNLIETRHQEGLTIARQKDSNNSIMQGSNPCQEIKNGCDKMQQSLKYWTISDVRGVQSEDSVKIGS